MSDKINIDKKSVDTPEDTDGKDDFTEGKQYASEEDAKKTSDVDRSEYEDVHTKTGLEKITNWGKDFIAGQNKAGRIGGILKDAASFIGILPGWMNKGSDMIGDSLKDESNHKPMLQKVKSLKNFINFTDEQGDFSTQELIASVLQIVILGGVLWGAKALGILDALMKVLGQ